MNPVETPNIGFSTGLKIGGYPVNLVFGGIGSGRLAGIGIQTEAGGRKVNRLFYRMDVHEPHLKGKKFLDPNPRTELDAWVAEPFHFHVMKYEASSTVK